MTEVTDITPTVTAPTPNRLHLSAEIRDLAGPAGKTAKEVYANFRDKYRNPSIESIGLKRTQVEKEAEAAGETYESYVTVVERRKWELDTAELKLRADLLDALQAVDMTSPVTVREIYKTTGSLVGSSGSPSLIEAIDMLAEAGTDVTEFRARLAALGFEELSSTEGD